MKARFFRRDLLFSKTYSFCCRSGLEHDDDVDTDERDDGDVARVSEYEGALFEVFHAEGGGGGEDDADIYRSYSNNFN